MHCFKDFSTEAGKSVHSVISDNPVKNEAIRIMKKF